jgi:hypothetical protein
VATQQGPMRVKRSIELPAQLWADLEKRAATQGVKGVNRLIERVCSDFTAVDRIKAKPVEKNFRKLDMD